MALFETLATWFGGKLADLALTTAGKGIGDKLKDVLARRELAEICASSIVHAGNVAPSIRDDIQSPPFLENVVLPLVRSSLEDPTSIAGAEEMVSRYVDMFVERFGGGDQVDETLARIFQSDRSTLLAAFDTFFAKLKSGLYGSNRWKEAQHYRATEDILQKVDQIAQLLAATAAEKRIAAVDVEQARDDARTASADLRAWPTEIHGIRLETPLLDRLIRHIIANPSATSLLTGEAGAGKSALMARLTEELTARGITTYAIKADLLPETVGNTDELASALGVGDGIEDRIAALAASGPVAILIDQLDAVSDVMDRKTARMQVLIRLIKDLGERARSPGSPLNIHVVVSSRPFEAAHDARFHQLGADSFRLDKLETEQVASLLEAIAVDPAKLQPGLLETLRRPFALKLFADIATSGADVANLASSELLDLWLARANLGASADRLECLNLLTRLAEEMVETETLWRPTDGFEIEHGDAVNRCVASGLLVRSGILLGFSHQSWLDDFQAKSYRTAGTLSTYVWAHQDSLFVRGTILRALERQRTHDPDVYGQAISKLLGAAATRRHIKHLIADIIGANPRPSAAEAGWVERWIANDHALAARALSIIYDRWELWQDLLLPVLPKLMQTEKLHWQAVRMLAAEVRIDADHVASLVERHWDDPKYDPLVFNILELSGFVGPQVKDRLATIFSRTQIDEHGVAHLITTLRVEGRYEEAVEVLKLWLNAQPASSEQNLRLYELEKLAEAAPFDVAKLLLPWFVEYASRAVDPSTPDDLDFPRSRSLPYDWVHDQEEGSPFETLRVSVARLGETDPNALWSLLRPHLNSNIDQVEEVIAGGLIAAGPALASKALDYLQSDTRRFSISSVHVDGEDGVGRTIIGWHSQELIRAISAGLDDSQLSTLLNAIESWVRYPPTAMQGENAAWKRQGMRWSEEARYPLLEGLPDQMLDARRRRQVAEWRAAQPRFKGKPNTIGMAQWVGAPMSVDQMGKARDAEIVRLLDELHDESGDGWTRRPLGRDGGVRALAQTFASFGESDPARAMVIAEVHFVAGRHEKVAGSLVSQLSRAKDVDHRALLELILSLTRKGFNSETWRQAAASALQDIARETQGLSDELIAMLESWLVTDAEAIAAQIADHRAFKDRNPEKAFDPANPRPTLFRAGGAMEVLPHDNFTILVAIANGLICRATPQFDEWLACLERHLEHPENPSIWTALLYFRAGSIAGADDERTTAFMDALWRKFPGAFEDVRLTHFLWSFRNILSDRCFRAIMRLWLISESDLVRQGAAELICAGRIVEPDSERYKALFALLDDRDEPHTTGKMFSAAAAWRESDPTLRKPSHALLLQHIPSADGPVAAAISAAVDVQRTMVPDELTTEMLSALIEHPKVLKASLNGRFIDGLQSLLLRPGFEDIVFAVTERITDIIVVDGQGIGSGLIGRSLVHVAIALQRAEGPLRAKAMDLYERLLDANVYGAEQAAKAALER